MPGDVNTAQRSQPLSDGSENDRKRGLRFNTDKPSVHASVNSKSIKIAARPLVDTLMQPAVGVGENAFPEEASNSGSETAVEFENDWERVLSVQSTMGKAGN